MKLATPLLVLVLAGFRGQDTTADTELVSALKGCAEKGFSYQIKPAADIPNFNSARDELAGAVVKGEFAGGFFHAQDGMFEVYRKGDKLAIKTERGWLPYDQYVTPLRVAINEAFDLEDGRQWRKGNVTKGREALAKLIRLEHLVQRSDINRLANIGTAFNGIKRAGTPTIDAKTSILYEGDLTDTAAFAMLQGPFEELVKRGNLGFSNVSGVGRIWIQDGVVRKMHARAAGKYTFYNEDDNVQRKGVCTLDIQVDITKVGETKVDPPAEARKLLE